MNKGFPQTKEAFFFNNPALLRNKAGLLRNKGRLFLPELRQLLPNVVRILKFCTADMFTKKREKHRN